MTTGQIALILVVLAVAFYIGFTLMRRRNNCPACGGTGKILGLRGYEKCKPCNGTGKIQ